MATGMQVWSTTPVNNATSDSNVNWAEGMAPSQVNDSARAVMASAAKWVADNSGVLITSGTSGALTLGTNQVEAALTTGFTVNATLGTAISGAATLAVDGLAATSIFTGLSTSLLVTTGAFAANQIVSFMFSTGVGPGNGWVVRANSPAASAALSPALLTSVTASLASSVNLSTAAFTDGPSVTAGSSGTWLVIGNICFNTAANPTVLLKLWDGTSVIAQTVFTATAGNIIDNELSGVITTPAGNLKLSGQIAVAGGTGGFLAISGVGVSSSTNASNITAVRIG